MKPLFLVINLTLFVLNGNHYFAQSLNCATNGSVQDLNVTTTCVTQAWSNLENGTITWNSTCGSGTAYQDVWYEVIGTGLDVSINISSMNTPNATLAVYTGCPTSNATATTLIAPGGTSCASITGASGSILFPTTAAQNYYVQIQRRSGTTNEDQTGNICAFSATPCGNPTGLLNDFCESAASLTKNPSATFSANTVSFSPDHAPLIDMNLTGCVGGPGNVIIQNNSWYKFIASSTTESFPFTYTSCAGVQAVVYRVTKNAKGCCTGFTQVSNCISSIPLLPPGTATITATGLTINSEYILMVDGFNGAQCDYTISGWSGIGILPIQLSEFMGLLMNDRNEIKWVTASEQNNDYFNLYRSYDGKKFDIVSVVDGAGNSNSSLTYNYSDYELRFGTVYYQLEQVDFDGKSTKSKIISLNRNTSAVGLVNAYPNPTETAINLDINVVVGNGGMVTITGINGQVVFEKFISEAGIHQVIFDMSELRSGIYLATYNDEHSTTVKRIVKK